MNYKAILILIVFLAFLNQKASAKDYYVHPTYGNDSNSGESKKNSFKTLAHTAKIKLLPGDRIVLALGQVYIESLKLINQNGTLQSPIIITAMDWAKKNLINLLLLILKV
jgi:hypothetical protein